MEHASCNTDEHTSACRWALDKPFRAQMSMGAFDLFARFSTVEIAVEFWEYMNRGIFHETVVT
jgi:hypothetical protein